jgi:hypothetical protein
MVKYGPLAIGLLLVLGLIPQLIVYHSGTLAELLTGITVPAIISILFFVLFFHLKDKVKYVAIGKWKIVVRKDGKEVDHSWVDVEEISLNRFTGFYKLKLKNEAELYFPAYGTITWLTGDDSDMGVIIQKMKNELDI